MNMLWDMRLYSYGYATRGVGTYVKRVFPALFHSLHECTHYCWGDREQVPAGIQFPGIRWIDYSRGSWKRSLGTIRRLVRTHHIDILVYWIAAGPIVHIGMGLLPPCKTIAVVHDFGVDSWRPDPWLQHVAKTWYWKVQRLLLRSCSYIIVNSHHTRSELLRRYSRFTRRSTVLYPPPPPQVHRGHARARLVVTLGGGPHKNIRCVTTGFSRFVAHHPETWILYCVGEWDPSGFPADSTDQIRHVGMDRYDALLDEAAALVICSRFEGLGLPVMEACAHGCPLILSDIPALRELGGAGARYVDPDDPATLADALKEVAADMTGWSARATARYGPIQERAAVSQQHFVSICTAGAVPV